MTNIFKEKEPESVTFIRNEDGTYRVCETGIVGVDENNKLLTNIKIEIPKCKIKWNTNGFIAMPSIEEVLKSDNEDEELYPVVVPDEKQDKELPLCTKINDDIIPRCIHLRERKYCTGKICYWKVNFNRRNSMVEACRMCYNARLDDELTDENDYSAITIGSCTDGYRMMLCSGYGRPLRIEIEKWDEKAGWYKIGEYNPKYCPNCGRKIDEYDN